MESAIVDPAGRLYFSATPAGGSGRLERMDTPASAPEALIRGVSNPGGLVFDDAGGLLFGFGNGFAGGAIGNLFPRAGLLRVNPDTGSSHVYLRGLAMANGLARTEDGTIFASDSAGIGIDRVDGRHVTRRWARVVSGNGLAVSPDGRFLYVAQTFAPAAIKRVEIAHPRHVTTYARPPLTDIAAGPDGMTIDSAGRLYVAANGAGQVWLVNRHARICVLARGLLNPSAVALGRGASGFSAGNLYVVTFSGDLVELPRVDRATFPG
jgi:sugar lactone lactonase YvrE